jgi:hypothetical protein
VHEVKPVAQIIAETVEGFYDTVGRLGRYAGDDAGAMAPAASV